MRKTVWSRKLPWDDAVNIYRKRGADPADTTTTTSTVRTVKGRNGRYANSSDWLVCGAIDWNCTQWRQLIFSYELTNKRIQIEPRRPLPASTSISLLSHKFIKIRDQFAVSKVSHAASSPLRYCNQYGEPTRILITTTTIRTYYSVNVPVMIKIN